MRNILDETSERHWGMCFIERHTFYERAKNSYAVICDVLQLNGDHMAVLSSQKVLLVLMEKSFS
jgi:L-fucose mutarotase/ribose pyranase (RbsD/FucU family)